ncbi:hypothetical protein ACWEQL_20165 [Kitasatospora sp. NPDC004240]
MAAADPLVVLLLALWSQAVAERDAFRDWVTEDPFSADPAHQLLQAHAPQTSVTCTKDTP